MVHGWMAKEPELWAHHQKRLNPATDYMDSNLLWVYDFFLYLEEKKVRVQDL